MAIGPEFVAKLLPALDELEARWRAKKISPDKAIEFCLRCNSRLGVRPEFEALRERIRVTLDAALRVREASPKYILRDVAELEKRWARGDDDNLRDSFEDSANLFARTAARSSERARVLAVLASVLDEATSAAAESPAVRAYLRGVLGRARWKRELGEPLPPARPRASFAKKRAASAKPKATRATPRRTRR